MRFMTLFLMVFVCVSGLANTSVSFYNGDFLKMEYADPNTYVFADVTPNFTYGEITLNSSGRFFVSSNTEFGSFRANHLIGVGMRLNVKPLRYLQLIQYRRGDAQWQTTLVGGWAYKRMYGSGFVDMVNNKTTFSKRVGLKINRNVFVGCDWANVNPQRVMFFVGVNL